MAGRPRQFDIDVAIDAALILFTEKGYEGASFAELAKSMGISPPSFYAAFGSKEGLFRCALERYVAHSRAAIQQSMNEPTARDAVRHLLLGFAVAVTTHPTARGCLLVQGALVSSDNSAHLRNDLRQAREAMTTVIKRRFEQAALAKDETLPGDPAHMARLTSMVVAGIATQAASGVSQADIIAAVESYIELFG
ncbi:TetR/AcrR family transcriptional regulator [Pseudomonas sp. H11T01]|uniref:TetR/AcrR family transcriptional regulator n=1 Tax=Pseudomonas sp. H11T01 TaxID=3402749 RepID=UPI003AD240E7